MPDMRKENPSMAEKQEAKRRIEGSFGTQHSSAARHAICSQYSVKAVAEMVAHVSYEDALVHRLRVQAAGVYLNR